MLPGPITTQAVMRPGPILPYQGDLFIGLKFLGEGCIDLNRYSIPNERRGFRIL